MVQADNYKMVLDVIEGYQEYENLKNKIFDKIWCDLEAIPNKFQPIIHYKKNNLTYFNLKLYNEIIVCDEELVFNKFESIGMKNNEIRVFLLNKINKICNKYFEFCSNDWLNATLTP
jgi:hypothetical protein